LQAVQQFGTRLAELQSALQRDKDTLAILDVALEAGATSEVASSVRHVARLLSEKQDANQVPYFFDEIQSFLHNRSIVIADIVHDNVRTICISLA